jgi:NAD(P)-dependent dehydrogenase (short-subunit alcohol dehydrogenase family)
MMELCNKVAIITGAAMGYKDGGPSIGGAISIRLARDGFKVVVVDIGGMGKKTVNIIKENGGEAIFLQADVTVTSEVKKIVQTTREKYGGLHSLVNCVARYSDGMAKSIVEISEEEWNETLGVNLAGYFKMAKYSIPLMLESGGGTIVNISSRGSLQSGPNNSVYSVSKAAVDALTRTIAVDFAPDIRANAILPGFVKIANSQGDRTPEQLEKWYQNISRLYPMKRVCDVEEIASVVSFLAGKESSYINGQTICVDGGIGILSPALTEFDDENPA